MEQNKVNKTSVNRYCIHFNYLFEFYYRKEAGVDLDGHFMIRIIYTDDMTYSLVMAAVKVLGIKSTF